MNDLIDGLKLSGIEGFQLSVVGSEVLAIFYADDMVNVSDTVRGLQAQIRIISNFCERTGMRVNLSKTKVVVFRNVVSFGNMKGGV